MIGQTLGHYRIVREIGAGGMGVVYQAEDTTLERQVALKILPLELAADDERRLRFAREARAIAALNHPNIVTVHSVEEAGGIHFITMELVKGKTLAELLPRHGFALGRFFEIAIPLADAVAAAHQQGITHRDLKPANVMIGDDGRIKVLDFGLAKADGRGAGVARRAPDAIGHAGRPDRRDSGLHVARAGAGRTRRHALGHLLAGHRLLRDADGPPAVRWRQRGLGHLGDPAGHATSGHRTAARGAARARAVGRSLSRKEPRRSIPVGARPPPQPRGDQAGRRFGRRVPGSRSGAATRRRGRRRLGMRRSRSWPRSVPRPSASGSGSIVTLQARRLFRSCETPFR